VSDFAGRFHDGKTAASSDVRVSVVAGALEIRAGGNILQRWTDDGLRLVDRGENGALVRLAHRSDEGARLTVHDARFIAALNAACPGFAARTARGRPPVWRIALLTGGLAAVTALTVLTILYLPEAGARMVPQSWENEIGRKVVDQVSTLLSLGRARPGRCETAPGRAALDALVARLADPVRLPHEPDVTVIDSPVPNAFAAPGGHVVLLRGILDLAESPDEVAGVLAHEFGHVLHRDPMKGVIRTLGLTLLLNVFAGDISGGEVITGTTRLVIGASYSRSAEADADAAAVDILRRAQIRTWGLERFFRKLAAREGDFEDVVQRQLGALSSHPRSVARAEAIAAAKPAGPTRPALDDDGWRSLKRICGGRVRSPT
jgi:Zn-dependent protease with chaperone function